MKESASDHSLKWFSPPFQYYGKYLYHGNRWGRVIERSKSVSSYKNEKSLENGSYWLEHGTLPGAEERVWNIRTREGISLRMPQERLMLLVPGELVPCQSPANWDQKTLQTLLASKTLRVYSVQLSSRLPFSLLGRRLKKWFIARSALRRACQCRSAHEIRSFIIFFSS